VDGSSTSARRPSLGSRRSAKASRTSASAGDGPPGRAALRALCERHGITPSKALGQHFLADPNLARAIVADARVGPRDPVLEVGAGLGSLTVALADAGCDVLAVEFDRALLPALGEVVGARANVRVEPADASRVDELAALLRGDGWSLVANLPYNLSVTLVTQVLERVPVIERLVVMVQREVGERFVAHAAEPGYGPVSVRVAYAAEGSLVRRVPREVFWPRPNVDSTIVRLDRRREPPVDVPPDALFRVVDVAFAERRKTIGNATRRLGLAPDVADVAGVEPSARPETVDLEGFARITRVALERGWLP
jgi:16S rRNA (adenine1518-N6/adenine1519-N6)-dimethyltransferase